MTRQRHRRAFLKWAGGKFSLLGELLPRLPHGDTLVEPFVGAGVVFLNTDYEHYWLNDVNPDLIGLYQTLQQQGDVFIREAEAFFRPHTNIADFYYQQRERFNQTQDTFERAVLFLYLNRHGYNGLCRYNSRGAFNVPFGRYKKPYFPRNEMAFFVEKAQQARFTCLDFESVFAGLTPGHVVYCDPPYVPLSASANFRDYHTAGFTVLQQQRLAELAVQARLGCIPAVLSNHDTAMTRSWYQEAELISVLVARTISAKGKERRPVRELIARYLPQA